MSDEIPVADENGGIRYLTAYTPDNPPEFGDICWAPWGGEDIKILGRRIIPTSTVILGEDEEEEDSV